jgi:adenine deaminase
MKVSLDLLIRDAKIFDVFRLRTFHGWVGIRDGRFIYVEEGEPPETIKAEEEHSLDGLMLLPGLIDSHMHIDSSHVTPRRLAEAAVPFGTTTILEDAHEMAAAGGVAGVQWMLKASKDLPLRIYHSIPSCIPATKPEMEWTRNVFTAKTIQELSSEPMVLALGEVMDYGGLLGDNSRLQEITQTARKIGLRLEGHIPTLKGVALSEYLSYGVSSDHTLTRPEKILEQISKGVAVMLQTKSITRENIQLVNSLADRSQILLVTDDLEPFALQNGHLSQIVSLAVKAGMPELEAIASATIRPARYLGLHDLGGIAPGYQADFMIAEKSTEYPPLEVYVSGRKVAKNGKLSEKHLPDLPPTPMGDQIPGPFSKEDFRVVPETISREQVIANAVVIKNDANTLTGLERIPVEVNTGFPEFSEGDGLALVAVFARSGSSSNVGILKNSGLRSGAFASSVAHDSHNLLVVGRDVGSMVTAANAAHQMEGGMVVSDGADVLARLPLPILGLLSDKPIEFIAEESQNVTNSLRSLGMVHKRPLIILTMIALSVSPYFKFTDKGVVDTEERKLLPSWE